MGNTRIVDVRHYSADRRVRRHAKQREAARRILIIMSYPAADDLDRIYWYRPVCTDNGLISGWQETIWDGFAANETAH
jgi:hypothetical protein